MCRKSLLYMLLACTFTLSLAHAAPPYHVPLGGAPGYTGETGAGNVTQQEPPDNIIFGPTVTTFTPTLFIPTQCLRPVCYAVFNPYLAGAKRTYTYNAILEDYTLDVRNSSLRKLSPSQSSHPLVFYGDMNVILAGGILTPIPSVAPDAEILSYEVQPDIRVEFYKDSADNLYVKPRLPAGSELTVRLKVWMGTDYRYFMQNIPQHLTLEDVPQDVRISVPDNVRQKAQILVKRLGLENERNINKIVGTLSAYFSTFGCDSASETGQDIYLAIVNSRQGACSQRAFGFFVTANSMGLPTRLVTNECHAFVEVYIPGEGWKRVDLGGCGAPEIKNTEGKVPFMLQHATTEGGERPDVSSEPLEIPARGSTENLSGGKGSAGPAAGEVDDVSDSDGDGLSDAQEQMLELDSLNPDSDGDGLSDGFERCILKTNPSSMDTDRDGTPDGSEDPDADGLTNLMEQEMGTDPLEYDSDGDGISDALDPEPVGRDSDGDGLSDAFERQANTLPNNPDSDGDGIPDGAEDPDGDGLINSYEQKLGTSPTGTDSDGDGLSDGFEAVLAGTDPTSTDTDGDGIPDGAEDPDGDGMTNQEEQALGKDPGTPDADTVPEAEPEEENTTREQNLSISLRLSTSSAEPGEVIVASGELTDKGEALPGRRIEILANNSRVADTLTNSSGGYEAMLNLSSPGVYILRAVYRSNESPYRQVESSEVEITVENPDSEEHTNVPMIIGAGLLLAGIGGAAMYLLRLKSKPVAHVKIAKDKSASTSTETPAGTDYRSRIIIAYNQLLRQLDAKGIRREDTQTHWEFCRRVLSRLPEAGEGMKRITSLYEVALYSNHPVDESHYLAATGEIDRIRTLLSGGDRREGT